MPAPRDEHDRVALFFDMANLYFAAKDLGIRVDYARLLDFLVGERRLQRAYAYLGVAPDDETSHSFLTWLRRNGFRVRTKLLRRHEDGTTGANLDMELAIDLLTQAPHLDVAILVSGAGDFVGLVDAAQRAGLRVEVAATPRQTATELRDVADRFIDLEANARAYARAELPARPGATAPLGRPQPRPVDAGRSAGPRPVAPQRSSLDQPPPPPAGAAPPAEREEGEEEDGPQPPTSDPRLLRRPPPPR